MDILIFEKKNEKEAKKVRLLPYLTLNEYQCRCKKKVCTRTLILTETLKSFAKLRTHYDAPIRINSAYRCQEHNKKVGGTENSFHNFGAAMDLRPDKDLFTSEDLDELEELAILYFEVVIRYDGFIHCHNRGEQYNPVIGEH